MKIYDMSRRMNTARKIDLDRWARRLGAEEMTIHEDGSVTLTCKDGYICNRYTPTAKEVREA